MMKLAQHVPTCRDAVIILGIVLQLWVVGPLIALDVLLNLL